MLTIILVSGKTTSSCTEGLYLRSHNYPQNSFYKRSIEETALFKLPRPGHVSRSREPIALFLELFSPGPSLAVNSPLRCLMSISSAMVVQTVGHQLGQPNNNLIGARLSG